MSEEPRAGHVKIRQEPNGIRLCSLSENGNQRSQLVRPKAVEEKMCDYGVKGVARWGPFERVCMNKLNPLQIQLMAPQPRLRQTQHARAGVYADNSRGFQLAPAFEQEPAVAFAQNEDVFEMSIFSKEGRPAALQLIPGEQEFHAAVIRCQSFKTHEAEAENGKGTRHEFHELARTNKTL